MGSISKREYDLERNRSKFGMVRVIYNHQRLSSKRRNHPVPCYSVDDLFKWLESHKEFDELYKVWVDSGYESKCRPSVDRLNDYLPYTLDNIRLTVWGSHRKKSYSDRKNGINNKVNRSVLQYSLCGEFVNSFHSLREAERCTGVAHQNIVECCRGNITHSHGFKWKYSDE